MAFPHAHFSCSPVLNHHLGPSSTRRRERDRMVAWAKHGTACQDCSSEQDDSGEYAVPSAVERNRSGTRGMLLWPSGNEYAVRTVREGLFLESA